MEHEPTIKQRAPTPEQLQRKLTDIRCAYEQLRRESKALGARHEPDVRRT